LEKERPGQVHVLIPYSQIYSKVLSGTLHARREWAAQNRTLVKDLIRALLLANRRVMDDPQFLYDEAVQRLGLDPVTAKEVADMQLEWGTFDPNGGLTTESAQYTLDFIKSIEGLPQDVELEDVVDLTYLNEVLDEIGRRDRE
jgi:ABC-type nitrate/sulfonate/bicarbonate transport system substrate-binding protein